MHVDERNCCLQCLETKAGQPLFFHCIYEVFGADEIAGEVGYSAKITAVPCGFIEEKRRQPLAVPFKAAAGVADFFLFQSHPFIIKGNCSANPDKK